MYRITRIFKNNSNCSCYSLVRSTSTKSKNIPVVRQTLREKVASEHKVAPFGWFLLVIPVSTFALGTWQVQRKKWKEDVLAKLRSLTKEDPIPLPEDLNEVAKLEYRPVHVKGKFLHDKELYVGPRSFIKDGEASTEGSVFSEGNVHSGYNVITPLKLSDRDEIILVNRGWVPNKFKNPSSRPKGQVEEEVDVIGIVRFHENRPPFVTNNMPQTNNWFYRDLNAMCEKTGAAPIFLDATTDFNISGGPIGGQTRISLRNEHLSYIITWYSLCALTSYLWYKRIYLGEIPANRFLWNRPK
ncbi:surfeit locus protein 1 [Agrilus planipennis]|uniref:SURF1-like protein n=1 Tax=Agrilus planipennis TaxID=224129 RepID=A0A1W4XSG6_AGRPL|nr:surfeit locus protein 1 [Agrilus planipennis]